MYSRNDYRYYLENHLMHSDDYLAHYGVKGMKWKKRRTLRTLKDAGQFVSDKGLVEGLKGKKLYNESESRKRKLRKRAPQIKAGSRLLAAEVANSAQKGITGAINSKRYKF